MALPSAPDGVCVLGTVNALSHRINWGSVSGASSYNIFWSEIPHDGFTHCALQFDGLTYYYNPQDPLNKNIRNIFYYKVSAQNLDGIGPRSDPSTWDPYGEIKQTNAPRPGLSFWGLMGS